VPVFREVNRYFEALGDGEDKPRQRRAKLLLEIASERLGVELSGCGQNVPEAAEN